MKPSTIRWKVWFAIFRALLMKTEVLWDMTPCRFVIITVVSEEISSSMSFYTSVTNYQPTICLIPEASSSFSRQPHWPFLYQSHAALEDCISDCIVLPQLTGTNSGPIWYFQTTTLRRISFSLEITCRAGLARLTSRSHTHTKPSVGLPAVHGAQLLPSSCNCNISWGNLPPEIPLTSLTQRSSPVCFTYTIRVVIFLWFLVLNHLTVATEIVPMDRPRSPIPRPAGFPFKIGGKGKFAPFNSF
jgi:hypothetical protein